MHHSWFLVQSPTENAPACLENTTWQNKIDKAIETTLEHISLTSKDPQALNAWLRKTW